MLRSQYGIAASSSVTPTALHAEDAQPNEAIYKRRHGHPPQIGSTWNNNYRDSGIQRGGYSGPWTQYGMRGNGNISRRGRGNFQPNRGGHHNSNPNQRHTGQVHRSTHHSVPPIATLPDDEEYHTPMTPSSFIWSSSPIKPTHQPDSPRADPYYNVPPDRPTLSTPTPQRVDDYRWLHRSRSPSPKLPQSAFKRRKIEHLLTHVSNSGRNEEDSVISQPVKHHPLTAEPTRPKSIDNKPLLPGRHRRFEGSASAPVHVLHSPEPLDTTVSSSTVPDILAETSTVKKEPHTPSPTRMERSLITSSCKFYPIPEFCKKSVPGFAENRKAFFREKMQELTRLRLTKIRSFFRYVLLPGSPRCTLYHKSLTSIQG